MENFDWSIISTIDKSTAFNDKGRMHCKNISNNDCLKCPIQILSKQYIIHRNGERENDVYGFTGSMEACVLLGATEKVNNDNCRTFYELAMKEYLLEKICGDR